MAIIGGAIIGGLATGILGNREFGGPNIVHTTTTVTTPPPTGLANIFVGAAGTCTRSASPLTYNAATSCGTHQLAYNASFPGDTMGIESATFTSLVQIDYNTANGKPGSANVTMVPDGVVTYLGNLWFGGNCRCSTHSPPGRLTIDGGATKLFHFGDFTHSSHLSIFTDVQTPRTADFDVINNVIASYITPYDASGGTGTINLDSSHNVSVINSQMGPVCCGNLVGSSPPTASGSPTLLYFGAYSATIQAQNIIVSNDVFLGQTRLGVQFWPTAAYGPVPQVDCVNLATCHADCIHMTGINTLSFDHNIMYGCDVQGLFFEQQHGGFSKDITITNNYANSFDGGHTIWINCNCTSAANSGLQGTWVIAGNTSNLIQFNGEMAAGAHMYLVGNRGPHGCENTNLSNCSCVPNGQTTQFTYLYNSWTGGGGGACGTGDITGVAFGVIDSSSWPSVTTNYDLAGANGSQPGENLVPQSECATYIGNTDIHGVHRPQGTNCDAGGQER